MDKGKFRNCSAEPVFMPRLMFGGTGSGCGKTTVTAAVLQALTARKMKLAPYKCGPDYIDAMFHRQITRSPSINLDSVFLEPEKLRRIFTWHMKGKDMALIEGVMGYYDGQANGDEGGDYHVASITKHRSCWLCPENHFVSGDQRLSLKLREDSMIQGVILNGVREGMYNFYRKLLEEETGLKVYGFLPKDSKVSLESRHLGLVTAAEQERLSEKLSALGELAEKYLDLDGLLALAKTAEPMAVRDAFAEISPVGYVRLAVAMDEAFCFYYEDNLELLRRLGAELVPFSPMRDAHLPENIQGIYLGGGYPELYAKRLSENERMKEEIRQAAERRVPIIGECGGYMYLAESIQDGNMQKGGTSDGRRTLAHGRNRSGKCRMTGKLGPFGCDWNRPERSLIGLAGETFMAHEFHYSVMDGGAKDLYCQNQWT
ncbi:cobyrinate a,c-diamide synthase [Frisingicoccus sp.]|uniref:cobyrinate a,c-diamide synthase n=1 Tax=Frisingicoccus sp. TaxID=1918627 RepID=UPI0039996040